MPNSVEKFEAGSPNIYAIAGLYKSIEFINKIGICEIYKREKSLTAKLKKIIRSFDNIKIIGDSEGVSIVSCVFKDYSPDEIGYILSKMNISVRTGLHCAPLAHKFFGTLPSGTVRFSLSYFNSCNDLDMLENALNVIKNSI